MKRMKTKLVTLGLASLMPAVAMADIYNFTILSEGTFEVQSVGVDTYQTVNTFTSFSLESGVAALPASMVSITDPYMCVAGACELSSGTFVQTFGWGDQLYGTFEVTASAFNGLQQSGSVEWTSGTGFFSGATGTGTFEIALTYSGPLNGSISQTTVGTIMTPVPEPAAAGMMLAGLAFLGATARRKVRSAT